MDGKGLGHIILLRCLQKTGQLRRIGIFMVMASVTRIWLFVDPSGRYTQRRRNKLKGMAVFMANGLGHMAGHTGTEGMDSMGRPWL